MLRPATREDLEWANARWAEVGFVGSGPGDRVVVLLEGADRVAVGRVVPLRPGVGELGGIYVAADRRRRGAAERVVRYLLEHAEEDTLLCLPFAHLRALYERCGFADPTDEPPAEVLAKHAWCLATYPDPVVVLQWRR